jgi:outer membrane protein OmpA-like peptidoglycan-associated protein
VSDADFQSLAARRTQAVQAYLVQAGKVQAGRIFVTASGATSLRRDGSRAYLQLQ